MSVSGDRKRKELLAEAVRQFVFELMEGEPEFSGGDAGAVAARTQRAFEKEYDNMNVPEFDTCPNCGEGLDEPSSRERHCSDCEQDF